MVRAWWVRVGVRARIEGDKGECARGFTRFSCKDPLYQQINQPDARPQSIGPQVLPAGAELTLPYFPAWEPKRAGFWKEAYYY